MKVNWYEQMTVNDHLVFFSTIVSPTGGENHPKFKTWNIKKKNRQDIELYTLSVVF